MATVTALCRGLSLTPSPCAVEPGEGCGGVCLQAAGLGLGSEAD